VGNAGYRRLAVSNFAADTFEDVSARMPFLREFDDLALSGRLGVAKPDAAIFQVLIQRTGLNPARAVFVDDVMDNVLAAEDLGFNAVMFESADQFAGALAERGVSLSTLTNVA
jgi:2-haloacid dehalogenase